jgi:DNA-binding transcriptional LysR family regulator
MQLRPFRYFLAVAEELHFGRAARRLGMAQPPLSRQIRALEQELGVVLFHRTKRDVQLTDAGVVFVAEARTAVERVDRAIARAQQAGRIDRLQIGYTSTVPYTPVFSTVIREYRRLRPGIELGLREMSTPRQLEALADGKIDVAFVRSPIPDHPKSIALAPLMRERLFAALRDDHPLAAAETVAPEALAKEPLILTLPGSWLRDYVTVICREAGSLPHVVQEAQQIADAIPLVAAGLGVSFVPESACNLAAPGVVFRPLSQTSDPAEVALAYRRGEASTPVQAFIALAIDAGDALQRVGKRSLEATPDAPR